MKKIDEKGRCNKTFSKWSLKFNYSKKWFFDTNKWKGRKLEEKNKTIVLAVYMTSGCGLWGGGGWSWWNEMDVLKWTPLEHGQMFLKSLETGSDVYNKRISEQQRD